MNDWSLDPRVRAVLKHIPLPIQLPTPLRRARGATGQTELEGRRAVVTRLRDDLDLALCQGLAQAGAAVVIADAEPHADRLPTALAAGMRHVPWGGDTAAGLLAVIQSSGATADRRPVVITHRVDAPTDENLAVNDATDRLFGVGHAAAQIGASGRVLLVFGQELETSVQGSLTAAAAAGFARSAFKEFGPKGTTVHVLRQTDAAPATVANIAVFLAGPRAAFLTGLDLQIGKARGSEVLALPRLRGKVALVTGAARGIGAAIAERLAREGAHVWVNDIESAKEAAAETVARIRQAGGQADFVAADVAAQAGAQAIRTAVGAAVDIVIHNAGITRDRTLRKMTLENWRLVLRVNFGAMGQVQEALGSILRDGGSLVLMSSVMGIAGNFGQANYSASKAAVIALSKQWSAQLAPKGVRANVIAPGFILTEMTAHLPLMNREMAKQLTALLQPGLPDDVAELACFLAGPDAAGLSGQVLRCDGGMAFGA